MLLKSAFHVIKLLFQVDFRWPMTTKMHYNILQISSTNIFQDPCLTMSSRWKKFHCHVLQKQNTAQSYFNGTLYFPQYDTTFSQIWGSSWNGQEKSFAYQKALFSLKRSTCRFQYFLGYSFQFKAISVYLQTNHR